MHSPAPVPSFPSRSIAIRVPVASLPAPPARPEWLRIPRPRTVCPHSGLNRDAIYRLLRNGAPIETRKVGGVTLVRCESLMDYIESCPAGRAQS
jgi:hypothetical protein